MSDLPQAVDGLVGAATSQVDPRTLKGIVEKVLDGFEGAPPAEQNAALKKIGRALGKVDGRGAQILSLALGALVEGGASPELAWPAIAEGLTTLLERATAFAGAVVKHSKEPHVDAAVERSGAAVAKKRPQEAEAWKATPSRCLAAVACVTKSKKIRSRVRKDVALQEACWPLSDAVSEVGFLLQALRIVDDETFLVLAPDAGRGWRVAVDTMPSNAELYVLLADLLVGDPKKGRLPGKRPDPKAVAAIREGSAPPKRASSVVVPFHLVAWTALEPDGSLPPADSHAADHWISVEGIPADIPRGPGKETVVLVQDAPYEEPIPVAPSFESLRPSVQLVKELSADEVRRTCVKLAKAAAKASPASHRHSTEPARPSAKKKAPASKKAKAKSARRKP